MAIFNDVKNVLSNAAQSVSNMTKESVEISRLNNESRNATNELTEIYTQIGRTYVDNEGAADDLMNSLYTRATELRAKVASLELQKMALRNQYRCPTCGSVMNKNANFCSNCGTRMPEQEAPNPEESASADVTYCPSCGAMRKSSDSYCEVCGFCLDPKENEVEEQEVIVSAPVMTDMAVEEEDEIPDETDAE